MIVSYQQRVAHEKVVLDLKREKLAEFLKGSIYPTLPQAEQGRLVRQARIMGEYSAVLGERIAHFGEQGDHTI